jgi:putative lipase involved disintegration of autophagic bodies
MAEMVQDAIRSYNGPVNDVLFTGHSAGGAVAALLYLHFQLTHALGNVVYFRVS